ncbi:MAG: GAF domain-containing protein, partial [Burkholderiales bacterium]
MFPGNEKNATLLLLVAGLLVSVFIADYYTRLGLAEWIFYVVPVGICIFSGRPALPLYVAAIASVLVFVGFVISPFGVNPQLSAINRAIGIVTIWIVTIIVRQVVQTRTEVRRHAWINAGHGEVSRRALGDLPPEQVGSAQLAALAQYLHAEIGALYRIEGDDVLRIASYGLDGEAPEKFRVGQGLVGRVALDATPMALREVPAGYLKVRSALGAAEPRFLLLSPLTADGMPSGVIELGFMHKAADMAPSLELLERIAESMGIALRSS